MGTIISSLMGPIVSCRNVYVQNVLEHLIYVKDFVPIRQNICSPLCRPLQYPHETPTMTEFDLRPSLASYLRSIAEWRRRRYQDDLRDPRNLTSATGLDELANWIVALTPDDPRVQILAKYAAEGERFTPGQQVSYEIGRFRFYRPDTDFGTFLDHLSTMAEADHNERGRFGGKQVPGDEPW